LKPAFRANGTITPAASSANADGAAALILTKRSLADRSLPVLAEIKDHATHSQEPQCFTTAPIPAIRKLLDKIGWSVGDVELFEINEAFAVVAMAAQRDLGIPREKLNINGGACALGQPIGATGARLIVTLLHALDAQNLKRRCRAMHRRRRSDRHRGGVHRPLAQRLGDHACAANGEWRRLYSLFAMRHLLRPDRHIGRRAWRAEWLRQPSKFAQ